MPSNSLIRSSDVPSTRVRRIVGSCMTSYLSCPLDSARSSSGDDCKWSARSPSSLFLPYITIMNAGFLASLLSLLTLSNHGFSVHATCASLAFDMMHIHGNSVSDATGSGVGILTGLLARIASLMILPCGVPNTSCSIFNRSPAWIQTTPPSPVLGANVLNVSVITLPSSSVNGLTGCRGVTGLATANSSPGGGATGCILVSD